MTGNFFKFDLEVSAWMGKKKKEKGKEEGSERKSLKEISADYILMGFLSSPPFNAPSLSPVLPLLPDNDANDISTQEITICC